MKYDDIETYVSHIGFNTLNLGGSNVERFLTMDNVEISERQVNFQGTVKVVRTLVATFCDESEMLRFLQKLVDEGVPFTDDPKSVAYLEASNYRKEGKLHGEIIGC